MQVLRTARRVLKANRKFDDDCMWKAAVMSQRSRRVEGPATVIDETSDDVAAAPALAPLANNVALPQEQHLYVGSGEEWTTWLI